MTKSLLASAEKRAQPEREAIVAGGNGSLNACLAVLACQHRFGREVRLEPPAAQSGIRGTTLGNSRFDLSARRLVPGVIAAREISHDHATRFQRANPIRIAGADQSRFQARANIVTANVSVARAPYDVLTVRREADRPTNAIGQVPTANESAGRGFPGDDGALLVGGDEQTAIRRKSQRANRGAVAQPCAADSADDPVIQNVLSPDRANSKNRRRSCCARERW